MIKFYDQLLETPPMVSLKIRLLYPPTSVLGKLYLVMRLEFLNFEDYGVLFYWSYSQVYCDTKLGSHPWVK